MDEINGEDVLPPMGIIFSTSLVELERIQQLEELAVLLRVLQLDVVLLQPVQCQLGLVVDVDLHGILHELLADTPDVLAECGAEHHDLLLVRRRTEDLLHVASHVWKRKVQLFVRTKR